ncbi:MAG TPA: FAD-binding and (Fe-S)-binding domain-containing protein [Bryobacteraceae bacterium]|nr:FAD-binding and (Fe-S)-binding domain-containing protein [Bryobacteraceae bacterium]
MLISSAAKHQSGERGAERTAGWAGDAGLLERELRGIIRGEVRFDSGSRALYATDASNYRQVPIGVVLPRDDDDVVKTLALARQFGAPVLSRGGGTSLAGQCCNVAVLMDFTKYMHGIRGIDRERKLAWVEPGCILDDLRTAANCVGLTFGPDPATHNHCTLGGMCGNNSCGTHSQMAGRTADNIHELSIVTYDGVQMTVGATSETELEALIALGGRRGDIYRRLRDLRDKYADLIRERYPKIPRRVSGYNLDELLPENGFHVARALVGTESTCVTYLEIVANLVHNPPARVLLVLGYPDVFTAGDHIPEVNETDAIACEGLDDRLIEFMHKKGLHVRDLTLLPEGRGWLLVEFGGETRQEAEDGARRLMDKLKKAGKPPSMKLYDNPAQEKMLWEVRESGLGATAFIPGEPDSWPGWEDSAVPPDRVGRYLRDFRRLFDKHGVPAPSLYGHFGQGCIHCRIPFDLKTAEGIRTYRAFVSDAADLVVAYGGSLSGEHGDGQSRAELLPKMYGAELVQAFREFKSIWDPDWKMNPGKVVDPHPIDADLRLGTAYHPPEPATHFSYPADQYSFSRAAMRCVGVGACRRENSGTMCPSYMATREEMHSTRGRAHLLFEMLRGDPLEGGWRNEPVREALDLCLSCKGCKGECPVNVDMATYKSEFLSHYYEGRVRPRNAYASGLIHWWSRAAERSPATANFLTQTPVLRSLAKWAAGYAQVREIPRFAPQTFKQWFRRREPRNPSGQRVILWADTFNDHFTPRVAKAAVEVLENAGCHVLVPEQDLCCGRPLYDYGMLDTARQWLLDIIGTLEPEIEAGTPVVGLEPSCVSVFRDEMPDLLHGDENALRLQRQSFLLSEFLAEKVPGYEPPHLSGTAIVQGHCHHKSVLRFSEEIDLLKKAGMDLNVLDSGCCGMAGAFGYEKDHYEVSQACGERVLLPAVRNAPAETLILSDGFSCREQILQGTGRTALHFAQVLQMAIREGPSGPSDWSTATRDYAVEAKTAPVPWTVVGFAAAAAAGAWMWRRARH